jgi:hypothetical protein
VVLNADGSNQRSVVSPALRSREEVNNQVYFFGAGLAWTPAGDGLLQAGLVRNCGDFSGDLVGDPQLSVVGLDNSEQVIATGQFDSLSFDRTGTLIGAVARADNAAPGEVRLYDLSGNVVLTVGAGEMAVMQP